jgi:UDP-N-acetylmuramyl tripeptide synthase
VSNALAAAEVAVRLGHDPVEVARSLAMVPQVPGRFEVVTRKWGSGEWSSGDAALPEPGLPTVVVDFAHTADALENLLETARGIQEGAGGGRVWVVFGCGGDRDHDKRPEMGRVATRIADRVIVTTDNPRSEDPDQIIAEVVAGCVQPPTVEPDRRRAIRLAVDDAFANDLVLVAGKGHETGQTWSDRTDPFDDRVEVSQALNERKDNEHRNDEHTDRARRGDHDGSAPGDSNGDSNGDAQGREQ